ncbi:phospholipase D family protein [Novosphingobium sp. ZN18A2]|uniref:phospholipase D family protein n=1 Tax=Novosphingobium sp. ZN18A2 TaxID=3079861 RepID=UPI0030CC55FC
MKDNEGERLASAQGGLVMAKDGKRPKSRGRRVMEGLLVAIVALVAVAVVLKVANPLPPRTQMPEDGPLATGAGPFANTAAQFAQDHDGQTALLLLTHGIDAFAMRLAMVRNAHRSIDAQYYIWENDLSGRMLLAEIMKAADRGVRVRLLIDDNPTAGLDTMWAGVNAHPNISVRLFNPLTIRRMRAANYLFDFPRLNRRMHNKSFTVDGVASVVGGRNVGDEYFGARDHGLFIDVDALAIGAVVPAVCAEFERYWRSQSAYPVQWILSSAGAMNAHELEEPVYDDAERAKHYRLAGNRALETLGLDDPSNAFVWAPVRLVADDPAKAMGHASRQSLLATRIAPLFHNARSRIDLVSGYFVPGKAGERLLADAARRGVAVRAATNSIQVTDVPVVHAGYAPYRKPLLKAGVRLYEASPISASRSRAARLGHTAFSGGGESVHAKTFAIDERTFFVGSFNFDPRSALLNCEMGFVIDSPQLAIAFRQALDRRLPEAAYAVSLDSDGALTWTLEENGARRVWHKEPGTTAFSRALVSALSLLPIQWLL